MIEIDKRISEFCDAPLQTDIEILLCHACKVETQILVKLLDIFIVTSKCAAFHGFLRTNGTFSLQISEKKQVKVHLNSMQLSKKS